MENKIDNQFWHNRIISQVESLLSIRLSDEKISSYDPVTKKIYITLKEPLELYNDKIKVIQQINKLLIEGKISSEQKNDMQEEVRKHYDLLIKKRRDDSKRSTDFFEQRQENVPFGKPQKKEFSQNKFKPITSKPKKEEFIHPDMSKKTQEQKSDFEQTPKKEEENKKKNNQDYFPFQQYAISQQNIGIEEEIEDEMEQSM